MNDQSDSTGRREAYVGRMKEMARGALAEAKAWEAFKWVVVALLLANFLLIAGLYRGVASDTTDSPRIVLKPGSPSGVPCPGSGGPAARHSGPSGKLSR